jgi:SNF2 family DNA or RNA helicase
VERSQVELDPVFYEQTRTKTVQQFYDELKAADSTLRTAFKTVAGSGQPMQDRMKILEAMAGSMVTLRRYIGMAKLPKVCEILDGELAMNQVDKIVIFAVHKDVIEHTRLKLAKYGAVTLYGGTPPEKRQRNIDRFMKDPKCRVFIGNIVAAGTGITLTSAHEVAFMEADWVPANNAQAAMRCHRIGQDKPVRVRFFSCEGSVDEDVMHTLKRKTAELAKIF